MRDPRQTQLAKNLIRNAVNLQKGEKVWINMTAYDPAMVTALVEETYAAVSYTHLDVYKRQGIDGHG